MRATIYHATNQLVYFPSLQVVDIQIKQYIRFESETSRSLLAPSTATVIESVYFFFGIHFDHTTFANRGVYIW